MKVGKRRLFITIEKAVEFANHQRLRVLSLSGGGKLCYLPIEGWSEYRDQPYKIYHEGNSLPLYVIRRHPMFVIGEEGDIVAKEVKDITKDDYLVTFTKYEPQLGSALNALKSIFIEDAGFEVDITLELMRLVGYFLAEGSIRKQYGKPRSVYFYFGTHEHGCIDDCQKLIEIVCEKRPRLYKPHESEVGICLDSTTWTKFFQELCGGNAYTKHLPAFRWELPIELFKELLRGYLRGDASKTPCRVVAKTVSLQLASGLIWACKMHGISACLNVEEAPQRIINTHQGTQLLRRSGAYRICIARAELFGEFGRVREVLTPYPHDKLIPLVPLRTAYYQARPKQSNRKKERAAMFNSRARRERIEHLLYWITTEAKTKLDKKSQSIAKNYKRLILSDMGFVKVKKVLQTTRREIFYNVRVGGTGFLFGGHYPILLK